MTTTIQAKSDLFNGGKCFTKGNTYQVNKQINVAPSLMDCEVINDMGEKHRIGSWWREFEIIEN